MNDSVEIFREKINKQGLLLAALVVFLGTTFVIVDYATSTAPKTEPSAIYVGCKMVMSPKHPIFLPQNVDLTIGGCS